MKRYFADRQEILERATSRQSFQRIVGDLDNPEQMALVADGEDENVLILAGPGSGKTRVVVHRCAYLLRVKRVRARAILVLKPRRKPLLTNYCACGKSISNWIGRNAPCWQPNGNS